MHAEKMETKRLLRDLGDQAKAVGRRDDERLAAIRAERAAKAELLDAVVEAVKPALRAVGTRIQLDDADLQRVPVLGLLVAARKLGNGGKLLPGPVVDYLAGDPSRGRYTGFDLFLTGEAKLVEVRYDGPWSKVRGEPCSWDGEVFEQTAESVVAGGYDVAGIFDEVARALVEQADGRADRATQRTWATAERLHAVALLMRAP